ncbi:molecular chaperone TorD family protein [Morganella morganii]
MRLFTLPGFAQQWPCEVDNTLCSQLSRTAAEGTEVLKSAWQSLFAGPGALPAPPWGSVYLDAEGLLQGDSTLALSAFLKQERLKLKTPYPEPADHIGLILFQAAVLASEMRSAAVNTLLSQHLMNWLPRYAQRLDTHGHSPFYSALTRLALTTVQSFIKA